MRPTSDPGGVMMTKLIRDFVEVGDHLALDRLIETLQTVRDTLPQDATEVEVQMRGDDVFGRRLSISFLRPKTDEEAACDARYAYIPAPLEIAA